jgi:hypothetical protein
MTIVATQWSIVEVTLSSILPRSFAYWTRWPLQLHRKPRRQTGIGRQRWPAHISLLYCLVGMTDAHHPQPEI